MLRSLIHYWRIHLAVILGAAVATSVLTGALLVGDSVEGSLRALTIGRLGKVDHAIRSTRYFRERLAAELASSGTGAKVLTAPVLVARATLQNAEDGRRANKVLLLGVDDRFGHFFNGTPVANSDGSRLRVVHANGPLMRAIGGSEEDAVILTVEAPSSIHREFLFGHDQSGQQTIRRRLRLGQMAEDDSGGRFSFEPS